MDTAEQHDPVNHPSHYADGKVECIDALEAALGPVAFKGYLRGNAMKYMWRAGKKDDTVQDLKKAVWYISKLIKAEEDDLGY